jgi:hypothetical protein
MLANTLFTTQLEKVDGTYGVVVEKAEKGKPKQNSRSINHAT